MRISAEGSTRGNRAKVAHAGSGQPGVERLREWIKPVFQAIENEAESESAWLGET
jgi:hypothetical protein